jgi:hypothetical protein
LIQFVSQVCPPSAENACSERTSFAETGQMETNQDVAPVVEFAAVELAAAVGKCADVPLDPHGECVWASY